MAEKNDEWRNRQDLFDNTKEKRGKPRKKSGEEILEMLNNWEECPEPGKKRKRVEPLLKVWKTRTPFWDLEYWKYLSTPHCIDVMHIAKNVCESLVATILNIPDKTKDTGSSRKDLEALKIREGLWADVEDSVIGKVNKTVSKFKPACYNLSPGELDKIFNCLANVRVSSGHSSNIHRYLSRDKKTLSGMKSHDCHVMITQILPVAIRGIMEPHVRKTLQDLCNFFDVISHKSISVERCQKLQEEIVVILCELEVYFPPSFFDIMVHLLVHVIGDIIDLGPVFLHNMFPFERLNGILKRYVHNRSHPDGSIVQGFLTAEVILFCTDYLEVEKPLGMPKNKHVGRLNGVGHKKRRKDLHVNFDIPNREPDFIRAHTVVLQHIKCVTPYARKHILDLKTEYRTRGINRSDDQLTKEHNRKFADWFKTYMRDHPLSENDDKATELFSLASGPAMNVTTYQAYDINGYTFYTEARDKLKGVYQNSGVTQQAYTGKVKNKHYGRIEEIWELKYADVGIFPMFRVRWAKQVLQEDDYFTTMVIPPRNESANVHAISGLNEPWVMANTVSQCFYITDPIKPSRVVYRRGKRSIVGMDEVDDEEDYDQFDDPAEDDPNIKYVHRRRRSTLPNDDIAPWLRRSHNKTIVHTRKKIKKIHVKTVYK